MPSSKRQKLRKKVQKSSKNSHDAKMRRRAAAPPPPPQPKPAVTQRTPTPPMIIPRGATSSPQNLSAVGKKKYLHAPQQPSIKPAREASSDYVHKAKCGQLARTGEMWKDPTCVGHQFNPNAWKIWGKGGKKNKSSRRNSRVNKQKRNKRKTQRRNKKRRKN